MSFLNLSMLPVCEEGRVLGMLGDVADEVGGL
jgi:hypothetical protein